MPTLLTEKDFRGEINIPGTERKDVKEELCRFIDMHEPGFMRDALGSGFAAVVYQKAALSAGREDYWDLLIMGGTYIDTYNGANTTRTLQGLKYCAARYVYYKMLKNNSTLTAPSGEVKANTENATATTAKEKMLAAWEEMRRELHHLWQFILYYTVNGVNAFDTAGMESPKYYQFNYRNIYGL